ncbi:MAG TPA: hypothetical protein DCX70_05730 [Chitinophagaceae bacterium]|nr:hypothetical protein [Chitinophagaceae bacterium]
MCIRERGIADNASSLPGFFSSFFMASCKDLSGLLLSKKLLLLRHEAAASITKAAKEKKCFINN